MTACNDQAARNMATVLWAKGLKNTVTEVNAVASGHTPRPI